MSESMSADGPASTPGSDFELDCKAVRLTAQNVSERVQLRFLSMASIVAVGALSLGAWALVQNSRCDEEEDS
ncbi:hypothetical protein ACFCV8_06935 [Streptomyces sp. NPDC056347]|uniref:hypothetical protein n=1 Tax=Streptomyces sp. NPDC056347 TaxID=3345790 RepID=UPI0035D756C8